MKLSLKQFKNVLAGFFIMTAFSYCHNFYKAAITKPSGTTQASTSINQLKEQHRFFYLEAALHLII